MTNQPPTSWSELNKTVIAKPSDGEVGIWNNYILIPSDGKVLLYTKNGNLFLMHVFDSFELKHTFYDISLVVLFAFLEVGCEN